MRLLIDENLSDRLVHSLSDCFEDIRHVRSVGLRGGSDFDIWTRAKDDGFAILTKDTDFQARSLLFGAPPKIVLIRLGNCTTRNAEIVIRNSLGAINQFADDAEASLLVVP